MLGPAKPSRLDQPITVSLEALVPRDHFYRHVEAKLDLSFVREWAQALYADRGRPSIDPVVFFSLQLILFFEQEVVGSCPARHPRFPDERGEDTEKTGSLPALPS